MTWAEATAMIVLTMLGIEAIFAPIANIVKAWRQK